MCFALTATPPMFNRSIPTLQKTTAENFKTDTVSFNINKFRNQYVIHSILVSPAQARCQHRRQYRPHPVSQLRRGNEEYNSVYFTNVVPDSL